MLDKKMKRKIKINIKIIEKGLTKNSIFNFTSRIIKLIYSFTIDLSTFLFLYLLKLSTVSCYTIKRFILNEREKFYLFFLFLFLIKKVKIEYLKEFK